MLGVKLGPELEARFQRFAHRLGRRRSDIGRAAIIEYLDRYENEDEFDRQLRTLAESTPDEDAYIAEKRTDAWLCALDEEDGGYDWGPSVAAA